ncbi:Rab-GAP TBC domain-containing protein [Mycena indigotica]|uniref:Rab-GAP TBC domain-containing protein n=1 Tax=Mycena indigotica TaxID=2126181 RepID=A0A8H6SBW1_9AGAR|nr:Rab-GAP TBC domain-containing protein [Mycena indigotica]KAF7295000.1 Rab-GAP TBC domain-containing protein [Mycena indigotica]
MQASSDSSTNAPIRKPSGACVHCKSLKVRCQFLPNQTICKRCHDGNHACVPRMRKKRKPAPTHEDLEEETLRQDHEIAALLAQWDQAMTLSRISRILPDRQAAIAPSAITQSAEAATASYFSRGQDRFIIPLYLCYFQSIHPYFSILDPVLHSDPADVIWSCPFLFTVICSTAARFYASRPDLDSQAYAFARNAAATALIEGAISVDVCQAYTIMAAYPTPEKKLADDRSWLYLGMAIRIGIQLKLDQPAQSEQDERARQNRIRTWLYCCCGDGFYAVKLGKMPMQGLDDYIARTSRAWYQASAPDSSGPFDVYLHACVQLLRKAIAWRGTTRDLAAFCISTQEELAQELEFWSSVFDRNGGTNGLLRLSLIGSSVNDHSADPYHVYRVTNVQLICSYLRLAILARAFQEASTSSLSPVAEILLLSIDAAQQVVHIALRQTHSGPHFRSIMQTHLVYIAFAAAFLINLLRPQFIYLIHPDTQQAIVELVERLVDAWGAEPAALNARHSPTNYSRFISSLLAKHNVRGTGQELFAAPDTSLCWPEMSVALPEIDPDIDWLFSHADFSLMHFLNSVHGAELEPPLDPSNMCHDDRQAYTKLFGPGTTLSRVRDAALGDRLFASTALEVPGRSLAWKLFLLPDEPLQQVAVDAQPTPPLRSLQSSRKQYVKLMKEHLRAPDGSFEEGVVIPGSSTSVERQASSSNDLETNNPLSLHSENPWKEWFNAVETRKTILQDVERTFPEIAFFRDPEVQLQLTHILFIYSTVINPVVGYRQGWNHHWLLVWGILNFPLVTGMHELLAPLYYAVDHDSVEESTEPPLQELCARTWVAADAFALFCAVMKGASRWYEWQETPPSSRPTPGSPFAHHVHIPVGPVEVKPYVTPVVQDCNRVQHQLLRTTDPLLWKHMQATGIEPQIYGIRWLRLIYTREFPLPVAMKLWDGLFACDPSLQLAHWVCVAMLIRIRNELIPGDYSVALTTLLRYPSQTSDEWSHHTSILLKQALELQMSPIAATGNLLVLENRNLLNIPSEVPAPPPPPQRRGARHKEKTPPAPKTPTESRPTATAQTQPQASLEGFARGLLERGESFGINRTLMNAVPEFRRNLSELAASFVRSPTNTSFPLVEEERPDEERPPWEAKSRRWYDSHIEELEASMTKSKTTQQRLAEGLSRAVDILLQDESEVKDLEQLKRSRREALEAISYVRDMLASNIPSDIDEERLFGEEGLQRRKLAAEEKSKASVMQIPQPAIPSPLAVVDSRPSVPPPIIPPTQQAVITPSKSTFFTYGSAMEIYSI